MHLKNEYLSAILRQVEIQYKNAKPTSLNHLDLIIPDYGSERVGGVFGRLSMEDFVENGRARIVPGKKPSKMVLLYKWVVGLLVAMAPKSPTFPKPRVP